MADSDPWELGIQTVAASAAGAAGLVSPELGAAATALVPTIQFVLERAADTVSWRRRKHVHETIAEAAATASQSPQELLEKAVADDAHHEFFARVVLATQDAALREKRLALGRALAAGLSGDEASIDEELLFIRAVSDLDAPHIQLLYRMGQPRAGVGQMAGHALVDGWTIDILAKEAPTLEPFLATLLATLQQHGLIALQQGTYGALVQPAYNITSSGRACLDRLSPSTETPTM